VARKTWGLLLLTAACARQAAPPGERVTLFADLGRFHVPISTKVPAAQQYFDQGMRLTYAFNHAEAIRAFTEASRLDPSCAICQWGIAFALGPNINAPMDSASGVLAWKAISEARRVGEHASERERAFIEALASRYAEVPPVARAGLDSAYARAMGTLATTFPDDLEAAALHADARMNLRPWDYWEGIGRPRPGTDTLVQELERVIAADSMHPGACHLYIHAVEATEPARAVVCAERLAALMPGAGHLVHMPSHIYVRVGRYAEAIEHNQHATHADSGFAAAERVSPAYATLYVSHNHHFLGFAAMLVGRPEVAMPAGRQTVEAMPLAGAQGVPEFQPMLAFEHLILLKFGRWDSVLALPLPDSSVPVARAVGEYARGTALAAKGQIAEAEGLLPAIAKAEEGPWSPIAKGIVAIARHSLAGEIAARQRKWRQAEEHFRAAMAIEDGFTYMEPPWWIEPVRHPLGRVLLESRRPAEAERLYREDLARFPLNVWSLAGLDQSLKALGKADPKVAADLAAAVAAAKDRIETSHR
jgi:tetratricopeptide (TPR) repeat protein